MATKCDARGARVAHSSSLLRCSAASARQQAQLTTKLKRLRPRGQDQDSAQLLIFFFGILLHWQHNYDSRRVFAIEAMTYYSPLLAFIELAALVYWAVGKKCERMRTRATYNLIRCSCAPRAPNLRLPARSIQHNCSS